MYIIFYNKTVIFALLCSVRFADWNLKSRHLLSKTATCLCWISLYHYREAEYLRIFFVWSFLQLGTIIHYSTIIGTIIHGQQPILSGCECFPWHYQEASPTNFFLFFCEGFPVCFRKFLSELLSDWAKQSNNRELIAFLSLIKANTSSSAEPQRDVPQVQLFCIRTLYKWICFEWIEMFSKLLPYARTIFRLRFAKSDRVAL